MRVRPAIEGNLDAWEYLRGLKTVFSEVERRERNVRLLDFAEVRNNTFHVTDEFSFTNGTYTIRPDVAFLINGIPLILIETKAATIAEGISKGLDRVSRYHREAPELLALMQLFGLAHLVWFYCGATWSLAAKNHFNWKDEFDLDWRASGTNRGSLQAWPAFRAGCAEGAGGTGPRTQRCPQGTGRAQHFN